MFIALDEKLVIGGYGNNFLKVFSRNGALETIIRPDDVAWFGSDVATLGDKILKTGVYNGASFYYKAYLYSTNGDRLKGFDEDGDHIGAVALSDEWIVLTSFWSKTTILYSNSGDFPKNLEIDEGGRDVAVSGDKLVIGDMSYNDDSKGQAWLYKTDGTLIKELLDPFLAMLSNRYGNRVQFIEDKVLVSCNRMSSVFIYSSEIGDYEGSKTTEDRERFDYFGSGLCVESETYYAVGADGKNRSVGSVHIYRLSDLDHGFESFGDVKTAI